ncbi:MAG: ANTAR domain-containing protein, partial [Deltaproteobacteria bacterium]|nr:ANTAR domain-containing protein [Deltaproteobacteria bacterium]
PLALVLLTAYDDEKSIRAAADAGIMAYLVKPVRQEQILPAVEVALVRFKDVEALRKENVALKDAIEARKIIEKAKGLLMEKEGLNENESFIRIRKISMDRRKSMKEIAEIIILAFEDKERLGFGKGL